MSGGTGASDGSERQEALPGLTLAQKASLTSGADFWHLQSLSEAGIEGVMVTDGPHGLRKQLETRDVVAEGVSVPATCFPPAVALASSWDCELVERVGRALGREARAEGVSVVLGPGVNIKRTPLCGRNFEYFSEDPLLAGQIGAAWVRGVQSEGVGASLKHFVANNQETDRHRVSADIDERTLREIYLPAFEHIIAHAHPLTVMAAYNKLNGVYACEHPWLLTTLLRQEWGFNGLIISDWGAVSDRVSALAAGLDVEMPPSGTDHLIEEAVRDGALAEHQVDAVVRRILDLERATAAARADPGSYDADRHHGLARAAAASGAVLLKNDGGLLPLDPSGSDRIAVIGEFARTPRYQGAGSSHVVPTQLDTALDAMTAVAGERLSFAPGFALDRDPAIEPVDDAALVDDAVRSARDADVVVLFLGLPASEESEGFDRSHLELPAPQVALLRAVHAANPNTVVVLSNGGVVRVSPWQHHARALLEGWLLGQAGGSATADLLFGTAEPSGRLAETIPLALKDTPAHLFFPGAEQHVRYGEGLYVGYRFYDTLDRPVAYPFGFGLGYTTFDLGEVTAVPTDNGVNVTAEVTNSGARAGSEVVQVYVADVGSSVDRPVHELRGFAKLALSPGVTAVVTIALDQRAFSYWSALEHRWKAEAGQVEIQVGFSSRDIRARCRIELPGDGISVPLNVMSTVEEWLSDAEAGPRLLAKVALPITPELRRLVGQWPMVKILNFGIGITREDLDEIAQASQGTSPGQPPEPFAVGASTIDFAADP